MNNIFIIDNDNKIPQAFMTELGESETEKVYALPDADKLIKLSERFRPAVVMLYDGGGDSCKETLKCIKEAHCLAATPVIIISEGISEEAAAEAFRLGAADIVTIPFLTSVLRNRLEFFFTSDIKIKESQNSLRNIQNSLISVIAELVEDRDKITGGHIERTQQYLKILIDGLIKSGVYADAITSWDLGLLLPSAQLHDVGKITISDLILNKPGKLTDDEFTVIKQHAPEGERIIDEIMEKTDDDGFLMHAKKFAGYHHEKWNGTGYPRGLKGEEIPLEGRIMAIADVYDALVSARPYKKPFTHEQAIEIIEKDSGTHFDPAIVEVFKTIADDFWVQSFIGNSASQAAETKESPIKTDAPVTSETTKKADITAPLKTSENTVSVPAKTGNASPEKTDTNENVFIVLGVSGQFTGKEIAITDKATFGRGKICSEIFSGNSRGISSIHCSIIMKNGEIYLIDKNSTFGTFLNSRKLSAEKPAKLSSGDKFWLGSVEEMFRVL